MAEKYCSTNSSLDDYNTIRIHKSVSKFVSGPRHHLKKLVESAAGTLMAPQAKILKNE